MKKQLTALLLAGALALSAAVVPASAASVEQFKKAAPEQSCTTSPFLDRLEEVEKKYQ